MRRTRRAGKPAYPNATVWLSKADADYWLNPASEATAPTGVRFAFPLARNAVAPYQASGHLRTFSPGDALPGGAVAMDTHGHTPGHVSYRFDSQGQSLLVWGDVLHFHAVQFAHPEAAFEADSDRTAAIASRRGLLQQATANGWWVAGAHLPFPGLGHVRGEGKAYAWVPAEYSPLRVCRSRSAPTDRVAPGCQPGDRKCLTPAPASRRSRRGPRPRRYGLRRRTPAR